MSLSFPSGHALQSAVVYLTLGALSMHFAQRRLTKLYCMAMAMLATVLVGLHESTSASTIQPTFSRGG